MDKCPLLGAKFGRRKTLRSACRPIGPGNRAEQYRQILEHQVNVGYFLSIHFKLSFKNCKLQIVSFQVESCSVHTKCKPVEHEAVGSRSSELLDSPYGIQRFEFHSTLSNLLTVSIARVLIKRSRQLMSFMAAHVRNVWHSRMCIIQCVSFERKDLKERNGYQTI